MWKDATNTMVAPNDAQVAAETLLSKVTSEILLAREGGDEGMIPLFSLLSELEEAVEADSCMQTGIARVRSALDTALDAAQPWTRDLIDYCHAFASWSEQAMRPEAHPSPFPHMGEVGEGEVTSAADAPPLSNEGASQASEATAEDPETDLVLVIQLDDDPELLREFHTEAMEHLEAIEEHVLVLERDAKDADSLSAIFRAFHTIKGVAGFLHLQPIQDLAHEVESLLDLARNDELTLDSAMITLILNARDALVTLVDQVAWALQENRQPETVVPIRELIAAAASAAERGKRGETAPDVVALPEAPARENAPTAPAAQSAAPETQQRVQSATIRVDAEKVANLMDTVGELVIVESQLAETAGEDSSQDTSMQRNLALLNRITKELQHTSMALRMVPIKPTFQKVGRMVRDLSARFNKEVNFTSSGEDTELDRNMVEAIGDPLIHMVRNALDHGLEPNAEERLAAGKSAAGQISLKAYHMGSQIVIELTDDGRGINAEKVLAKARQRELIDPERELTEEEIYQLIFLPGFSTADQVTDVSGRGVGMDVVRRNIEAMRGTVVVESTPGQGSSFKVKLPLTAAIIEGLVVKVGSDRFILPTNTVRVIMRPTKSQLATITGRAEVLNLRDQTIPIIRLHREFDIDNAIADPTLASLVIIDSFGRQYALLVDEMINKQEVVIKSLGCIMREVSGVAGGAILGDGTIALILDTASLLNRALRLNN